MANGGLALVCASIGGLQADDDGNELYVKSPDCLESLRDLQRYLRRDHPETRDIFLELGKWNVVRQDLVPLIKRYSNDFELVLNCVKILVFLTMPVDPTSNQVSKQVEYLQQFKASIVEGDAIAVIVSHLEEPLQNLESGCPKDEDWKLFQLFLTLVRNFLSIPDCLPQHGPTSSHVTNLRDQMLERLFNESAMELVVVLTQHVGKNGGLRQDNLLILEILQQAFWGRQADIVATAAQAGVKVGKQSEKSAATLRAVLESEKEQTKRFRKGTSPFTGMFVQVARDGSKTMLTRNPHQSPLENLIRKPQVKRGFIKRIVQDTQPVFHSSDQIYIFLKDFADQFLDSGYNILMQSVKDDIRRERMGFETPDTMAFFQVAQFFTSYQCYTAQKDQRHQTRSKDGSLDGAGEEAVAQKQLCGLIASTMDEAMFTMVISKWHEFSDLAAETKDWKPVAAAGGAMKDMIKMLDLILKRSDSLTEEGQQELRMARSLLYKVFYDQTEDGFLPFLNSLIRSFDIYKQPRSHLADLVEITHIVLRILDSFAKSGESLLVLKKVRGGGKKKSKPSEPPQTEGPGQDATEAKGDDTLPDGDAGVPLPPRQTTVPSPNIHPEMLDDENAPQKGSEAEGEGPAQEQAEGGGEARTQEQSEGDLEKRSGASSHEDNAEEEVLHGTPAAATAEEDAENSDGEQQNRTKEVTLNVKSAVEKFANNVVVRNYCWLLKFHSTNRAATNHYIVRMLQRICDDCLLEPMLYQISILQTFYGVLSNRQVQEADDHRFVIGFLNKLVRRLFKKLEAHPILFVDLLFWKTRTECHNISADYMIHSLRNDVGGGSQNRKRVNIADALGDDEEDQPFNRDSGNEGSATSSDDDDEAIDQIGLFSEEQEAEIKDLFERFKDDEQHAQLIASELDPFEKYTAAQVERKLRRLGLTKPSANRPKKKSGNRGDKSKDGQTNPTPQSSTRKVGVQKPPDGSAARRKSSLFSEAQDQTLKELFEKHGSGKNVTKNITETMGGEFTVAQVSRRLRTLGLVKAKPRTLSSALHANLTDSDNDDDQSPLGKPPAERSGDRSGSKKRNSSHDPLASDSDDDFPFSALRGPASRLDRPGSTAQQDEKRPRKKRVETVDRDSDDDDVPLTRFVRPSGFRDETPSGNPTTEDHTSSRPKPLVDLEDSEDEAPRPAHGEGGAVGGDAQEKHSRRRRVKTVDSDGSEDDLPGSRSMTSALRGQHVDLEDSDEDVTVNRMTAAAPSHGETSGVDQGRETGVRVSEGTRALEGSDGDVDDTVLPVVVPVVGREGGEGFRASIGGHHRKRRRVKTVDLSDSDKEGL